MNRPFKRGKYWYFYYYDGTGKRIRKSTGETVKYKAEEFIKRFLRQPKTATVTLAEYAEPFFTGRCPHLARLESEKRTIGTAWLRQQRARVVKWIINNPIGRIKLGNLTRGRIIDWRSSIQRLVGDHAANNAAKALKTIINEAFYREDIRTNPVQGIGNIKIISREVGIFTAAETGQMFNILTGRERIYFAIALEAGLRKSEILALKWGDIQDNIIHVDRAWKDCRTIGSPKWGIRRRVVLNAKLEAELAGYRQDVLTCLDDYLIVCWDNGSRISRQTVHLWYSDLMARIGIDTIVRNIKPHSFRHTYISRLKMAGVSQEIVSAMAGHTDKRTTDIYSHFDDEYLIRQIRG